MSFATDERARLFWKRAETDLVEQLAAASERVFDTKLTAPAAAALCKAIARRRLDAESQAAGLERNAAGTFADRPAELAHWPRAFAQLVAERHVRVEPQGHRSALEPPSQERPL